MPRLRGEDILVDTMPNWTVVTREENLPLLDYLQRRIPSAPGSYLRQLIRGGKVLVNDDAAMTDTPLRCGDRVSLPGSRRLRELLGPGTIGPVLFESAEILIVHKPAGLATHSGKGHEQNNLADRVAALMRERGERFMTAPAHRLDLETSGPVVFGKGRKAVSELGIMLQQKMPIKRYLALAAAGLPESGVFSSPVPSKGKVKSAATTFRALEQVGDMVLLELELRTGRQHQIRRQLADAGHPIVGDRRYRGQLPGPGRLFLHCCLLEFPDPFSPGTICVEDPLPQELADYLQRGGYRFTPPGGGGEPGP